VEPAGGQARLLCRRRQHPRGCDARRGTRYLGRVDVRLLERIAADAGMIHRRDCARRAVESGLASPAEIRRILGVATPPARILWAEGPGQGGVTSML
jgi:hypothetical protein